MITWLVSFVGAIAAWHFTDFQAESTFQSVICPIVAAICLMTLLIKFVLPIGPDSERGGGSGYGGGDGGFGGCGGGDGGGCGGGGE